MDQGESRRSTSISENARMHDETHPSASSTIRSSRLPERDWDLPISPRTRESAVDEEFTNSGPVGLRRRSWAVARQRSQSRGVPSLTDRMSLAERTYGNFTIAGPDDAPQARMAHEPFVQPGYADLNPSYEQPTSSKPLWSLAKPLPRVVRPGMVPTKDELLQAGKKAQRLAEHSKRLGLDVDPSDLEKGQIRGSVDPRKVAAQVKDARLQRESKLMNKILNSEMPFAGLSLRSSRGSADRMRRSSTWGVPSIENLPSVEEGEQRKDTSDRTSTHPGASGDAVVHGPDETDPLLGEEIHEVTNTPAIDEATFPDDLHPLVQDLVESEVHNNHTTWSVVRTHHREALAESLAVFVQLTVGFCADLAVTFANAGNPNTTAWAWGLATMMAIHVSGGVSGAHLNPAITLVLWFYRGFPQRKLPGYFAAQFIGAFCATIVAYGVYYQSIQIYLADNPDTSIINSFVTSPQVPWITPKTAFYNELLGTTILAITILALGDDQNSPPGAGMNSLIVGLVITCMGVTFTFQTGGALNPSRDFGPRFALLVLGYTRKLFTTSSHWFYGPWVGATCGAFIGGFLYDFLVFTGGESPVNYPLERTQRALKKSYTKWKRRLRLSGRGEKATDRL